MMDSPSVSEELFLKNLHELDLLNRYIGGHRISLSGLKQFKPAKGKTWHFVDIGCGSGDTLRYLAKWARRRGLQFRFTGVDVNLSAVAALKQKSRKYPEISGVVADAKGYLRQAQDVDFLHCALVCHHLKEAEIQEFMKLAVNRVQEGIILNDIRRSRLAWYSVKWFTRIMRGSLMARHDGPLSVLKAFTPEELKRLMKNSGADNYRIRRYPFFRLLVTIKTPH